MMISIGKRARAGAGLVELLLDCHKRIRTFIAMAIGAGERMELTADEVVAACDAVERYFTVALPLHIRDEEESLAPRLRGLRPDVDGAVDEMLQEHDDHLALVAEVVAACAAVRGQPMDPRARGRLASAARRFGEAMVLHLLLEEEVLFPLIGSRLTAAQQDAVMSEMRARR